jgi:flagellum-specific peptidoglycan hydrolase FlgJ
MVVPAAQKMQAKAAIPASITIAQAILESGWGQSQLALEANNYFGIKADYRNLNPYVEFPTHEWMLGKEHVVMAHFARYDSPLDSFEAHAMLIAHASRYQAAMQHCGNPVFFAVCLQDAGYSTSRDQHGCPDYALRIVRLIDQFDLTQYDIRPQDGPAKEVAA